MSKPVPLVYFHGDCPDGTTSAWAAWKHFQGRAEFKPLVYGKPFRLPEGLPRPIYMLDYALKSNKEMRVLEQIAKPFKFTVIDHHDNKGVRAALANLKSVIFVPGSSGARLTWVHFFPNTPVPPIVDYTEDRDLWNFKLPQTHEINAWLSSFPLNDPETWDKPAKSLQWGVAKKDDATYRSVIDQGEAILRFQEACFTRAIDQVRLYDIPLPEGGTARVKGANVSERAFGSEVGARLSKGAPFGFTWYLRGDGSYSFGLRSREGGRNVADIATHLSKTLPGGLSGGGHPQAAGMEFERLPLFMIRGYNVV
jgi:oligoribonuclease NrnB/cAMP/cGMP phosphodiesterase (DHH superfamily)